MSEFYVIIARETICSRIFWGTCPCVLCLCWQAINDITLPKKVSQDKQKLTKLAVRKLWKRTSNRFSHFRILYMFSHLHFADSISHFIRCPFSHFRIFALRILYVPHIGSHTTPSDHIRSWPITTSDYEYFFHSGSHRDYIDHIEPCQTLRRTFPFSY